MRYLFITLIGFIYSFNYVPLQAQTHSAACGCGSGLHAGGAVPTGPSFISVNKSINSYKYAVPFIPIKSGTSVSQNAPSATDCPYGKCACGSSETVTTETIRWIPYKKFQQMKNNGENVEIAAGNRGIKSRFSQTKKAQLSNLYYLSNNSPDESRIAAIELYENLVEYLGTENDAVIKDLIRDSINMSGDSKQTRAAFKHYKEIIKNTPQEQLAEGVAGLHAYREYFSAAM